MTITPISSSKHMKIPVFPLLFAVCLPTVASSAETLTSTASAAARYESGLETAPLRQIEQLVAQSLTDRALKAQLETALSGALHDGTTLEGRRFICQQLAVIGTEACLPALSQLLKNPESVGIACLALANNPSPKADAVLRSAARKLTGLPLVQVTQTIGARRDSGSVSLLKRLAASEDKAVAGAAVVALGNVASPQALSVLKNIRQRQDPATAAEADEAALLAAAHLRGSGNVRAAARLCEELLKSNAPNHVRRGAFETLVRLDRDGGQQRAADAMVARDPILSRPAIAAVATLKGDGVSKRFAALMPSLDTHEQVLLIQALAARGDSEARSAIQASLSSADHAVRASAITALGQIGDASTVPAIASALDRQPVADELKAIEAALTSLQGGEPVDKAIAVELDRRASGIRTPLLAALARRADPTSFATLQREATSADPTIVRLAFQGLSRIATSKDVPALLNALVGLRSQEGREDAEGAVAQALNRIGDPARQSALLREFLNRSNQPDARAALIRLLLACPDPEALAVVKAAMDDSHPAVRDAAMRTLAAWPDTAAWDTLANVYQQTDSEPQRVVALRGLVRLLGEENHNPHPTLLQRYRTLFAGAKSDTDRKLVLGALAGCAHPDALRLAVEQLKDSGVRAEAEAAVKRIAESVKAAHPKAAEDALDLLKTGK